MAVTTILGSYLLSEAETHCQRLTALFILNSPKAWNTPVCVSASKKNVSELRSSKLNRSCGSEESLNFLSSHGTIWFQCLNYGVHCGENIWYNPSFLPFKPFLQEEQGERYRCWIISFLAFLTPFGLGHSLSTSYNIDSDDDNKEAGTENNLPVDKWTKNTNLASILPVNSMNTLSLFQHNFAQSQHIHSVHTFNDQHQHIFLWHFSWNSLTCL